MKPHASLSQSLQKLTTPLGHAFQNLSRRDQIALLILAIFLLFFVVGVGGWTLHSKANQAQKKYDATMADVFWLRSQAGNINPNQTQQTINALGQSGGAIPAINQPSNQYGNQAVVTTVSSSDSLDQFMQLWLRATPAERDKIRQWVQK